MATIASLAHEYGMDASGLRAFSDDLLDGLEHNGVDIPEDVEVLIRDSLESADSSTLDDGTSDSFGWRE